MIQPLLSQRTYILLFSLLGIVYIIGLFLPLIDNDAAHHANIGLHMYLSGDYVTMVDHRGDYIDKPHFLFWLSALSYKIFGINSFAYRFPSFVFTIFGTYSIFRLGKELYDAQVGKLAALIAASSFCYILGNVDVRMDAILTACVAFSLWQLVEFVRSKKTRPLLLAAIGVGIGFITKGHVGFVTPLAGLFFYILYKKEWRLLYDWRWILFIFLFALVVAPVVYCFYLQYDLHPERSPEGMHGVSGVKYILWSHSFDRLSGHERFGSFAKTDHLFFFHTFLWTYAPWSVLVFAVFIYRLKKLLSRQYEWMTTLLFILLALLISVSSFKLPHYFSILAPFASIMLAVRLYEIREGGRWSRIVYLTQVVICSIVLLLAALVNGWAFPINNIPILLLTMVLLSVFFYIILTKRWVQLQKAVILSVFSMALLFFLLNTNFYPKLLRYQGGKYLADLSKDMVDPNKVYFMKNTFSSSFNFYSASIRKVYDDSIRMKEKKFWVIYEKSQQAKIDSLGLNYTPLLKVKDFEISRMNMMFFNPSSRDGVLGEMILIEVN